MVISNIQHDANGIILESYTVQISAQRWEDVDPDSSGEFTVNYVCKNFH